MGGADRSSGRARQPARPRWSSAFSMNTLRGSGPLAALPADRILSFCEASLFSLVTHLPFRKVMDVSRYQRLQVFCQAFG
jgi:hypothetical protein